MDILCQINEKQSLKWNWETSSFLLFSKGIECTQSVHSHYEYIYSNTTNFKSADARHFHFHLAQPWIHSWIQGEQRTPFDAILCFIRFHFWFRRCVQIVLFAENSFSLSIQMKANHLILLLFIVKFNLKLFSSFYGFWYSSISFPYFNYAHQVYFANNLKTSRSQKKVENIFFPLKIY